MIERFQRQRLTGQLGAVDADRGREIVALTIGGEHLAPIGDEREAAGSRA